MVNELDKKTLLFLSIIGILLALIYPYLPLKYFLVLVLGLIGGSLILNKLEVGIFAVVFFLPFLPDILSLLLIIFLFLAFIYSLIFKEPIDLVGDFMFIPIILYFILITYSTITSINPIGSLRDLAFHSVGIAFLFIAVNKIRTRESFNRLVTSLVFSAFLVSLYGIFQYIVGVEVDAAWVDVENNPDLKTRIYSVFYNPNILAEYLLMITPLSVALFWNTKKLDKKIIFLGTSLTMLLTMLLTFSRGGWLGIAFAAFIFILIVERRLLLSIIPISVLGVYFLPDSILNRILSIKNLTDSSNSYRLKLWEITGEMIRDNWKVGVGFGHLPFKETFETYIRTMPTYHAHNTFLEILAETGIVGFIMFIFLMFVIIKYGVIRLYNKEDRYLTSLMAGLISGISGVMLHGLVENVFYIPRIIISFWILISLLFILINVNKEEKLRGKNIGKN